MVHTWKDFRVRTWFDFWVFWLNWIPLVCILGRTSWWVPGITFGFFGSAEHLWGAYVEGVHCSFCFSPPRDLGVKKNKNKEKCIALFLLNPSIPPPPPGPVSNCFFLLFFIPCSDAPPRRLYGMVWYDLYGCVFRQLLRHWFRQQCVEERYKDTDSSQRLRNAMQRPASLLSNIHPGTFRRSPFRRDPNTQTRVS